MKKPTSKQLPLFPSADPPHANHKPTATSPPSQAVPDRLQCAHCGRPATKLCDFVVREPGRKLNLADWAGGKCDQPLCDQHATRVGSIHVDYADNGRRRGQWLSIDFCPDHAATQAPTPQHAHQEA